MAITTYSELQTAVANWLDRADLTSRIPEFIALAEADMRRQLRDKQAVASLTVTSGLDLKALGATVKEVTNLKFDMVNRVYSLRQMSMGGLATIRQPTAGAPTAFAVVDGTAYFDRATDATYTFEMTYIEKVAALSVSSPTNSTLTNSPDIYLFGAMKEAEPYLQHDERVELWSIKYQNAIDKENIFRERAEFGATPEQALPYVFGEDVC